MNILDIDLDFFLNNKHNGNVTYVRRLNKKHYTPWDLESVKIFLEENCGLTTADKIHGKVFTHHDEVFYFLRRLQEQRKFDLKFSFDHVDAHCDLGFGDASYKYIATHILNKPLKERAYPKKNGLLGLGAGNFLAFAIACRWIQAMKYINKIDWMDDIPCFVFKDFNIEDNVIQLKHFSNDQMYEIIHRNMGDMRIKARSIQPLSVEPEVTFAAVDYNNFKNTDKYDFIFLTQSPGFTPRASDELIPLISDYLIPYED